MKYKILLGFLFLNLQLLCAGTFTVTNTNDSGNGSLRKAIAQSNAESGMSKIVFSITGNNKTISLESPLVIETGVEIVGSDGVVLENTQGACIISCLGENIGVGDSVVLRNLEIGASLISDDRGQIELQRVRENASATFICDRVKMAFALTRSSHIKTCDFPWIIKMVGCEVANASNSSCGILYGKKLQLKNANIHDCRKPFSMITGHVAEEVLIEDCSFLKNTGFTYVSGSKTVVENCRFSECGALTLACLAGANINISNCLFEKTTNKVPAIWTSNPMDDWKINIEGCHFYNTKNDESIVSLKRSYGDGVIFNPSELVFVGNYLGIAPNGEKGALEKGLCLDIDKATIKDNVFANITEDAAIRDAGSDNLLILNNYFGTNSQLADFGNYGGVLLQSVDAKLLEEGYIPYGKKEYKEIIGNTFAYNEHYGVLVDSFSVNALISNNKFLHPKTSSSKAIVYTKREGEMLPPYFNAENRDGYIYVSGEGASGAVVELFRSSSENQTALELIDTFNLGSGGFFSANIPYSSFKGGDVCLSVTQTLYDEQKSPKTSCLSDSRCLCIEDTVFVRDTIFKGDFFMGGIYDKVGYDTLFSESHTNENCLAITAHYLVVLPSPSIKDYYVKISGEGDGTSWEQALSPKDFAAHFALVGDDVTFHIAAGTYHPVYGSSGENPVYSPFIGYYTNSRVNLIGGYSSEPFQGEQPDPKNNITTFDGRLSDELTIHNLVTWQPKSAGPILVQGIHFVNVVGNRAGSDGFLSIFGEGVSAQVKECSFDHAPKAVQLHNGVTQFENCSFRGMTTNTIVTYEIRELSIDKSTFEECSVPIYAYGECDVTLRNSTLFNCTPISLFSNNWETSAHVSLINNTIIGDLGYQLNSAFYELEGNIIKGELLFEITRNVSSNYNLYLDDGSYMYHVTQMDRKLSEADFSYLLESSLADNGGFTKTVALKKDQLPDGSSIRMLQKIAEDQRGVARLNNTCIGAYEIPCLKDITNLKETVAVGTYYRFGEVLDGVLTSVGVFEYTQTFKNRMGCDSIVNLELTVQCKKDEQEIVAHITAGEKYSFENVFTDRQFDEPGTYVFEDSTATEYGCYHKSKLTLIVDCSPIIKENELTAYVGEPFSYPDIVEDTIFTSVGTKKMERKYTTAAGCDSLVRLIVDVQCVPLVTTLTDTIMSGQTYSFSTLFKDRRFIKSDTYQFTDVIAKDYGCDSVVKLTLVVKCENVEVSRTVRAFIGKPFSFPGFCRDTIFTSLRSNKMEKKFVAASGCDSTVHLTVNVVCDTEVTEEKAFVYVGETFDFTKIFKDGFDVNQDKLFKVSGDTVFEKHYKTIYGCDSIVRLSLSVLCVPSYETRTAVAYVGVPFSYPGFGPDTTYGRAGEVLMKKTFTSTSNCDSTVTLLIDVLPRDSFFISEEDSVCQGLNYTANGWNLDVANSLPDEYQFVELLKSSDKTDTFRVLHLRILPNDHAIIEDLSIVQPLICHDRAYGKVNFVLNRNSEQDLSVNLLKATGELLSSTVSKQRSDFVNFENLALDAYRIYMQSTSKDYCFSDTVLNVAFVDPANVAIEGVNTIYTTCLSEPTAHCDLQLWNYDPSLRIEMNGRVLSQVEKAGDPNCCLVQPKDGFLPWMIHIDSLGVGTYTFEAVDSCGNRYGNLHQLVVIGPKPLKLELLNENRELACSGSTDGSVTLRMTGGSLLSRLFVYRNEGTEIYEMTGDTTYVELTNLKKGIYPVDYVSGDASCHDHVALDVNVVAPEDLKVDLMVSGVVCQNAIITAYTSGESGVYNYQWVKPNGDTITTRDNHLYNVGAGKYECLVKDETGCSYTKSYVLVSPLSGLRPLQIESYSSDETCFGSNNSSLRVTYSENNLNQAVTCTLTNDDTGQKVREMTSMAYWGELRIDGIAPGNYTLNMRYGTSDCNLSLDEVTRKIVIKAKKKLEIRPIITQPSCYSIPNGKLEFIVTGWEDNYKARLHGTSVEPVSISPEGVATFVIDHLTGGYYRFVVDDDCHEVEAFAEATLNQLNPLNLNLYYATNVLDCANNKNGVIYFAANGGVAGYNRLYANVNDFDVMVGKDTTVMFEHLDRGSYRVVFESTAEGCPDRTELNYRIDGPDPLVMDLQFNGLNCPNAGLVAKTSGETSPYRYDWTANGQTYYSYYSSNCPFPLSYGKKIRCKVYDNKNCENIEREIVIPDPATLPALSVKATGLPESCYHGNNGRVEMKVTSTSEIPYGVAVTCGYAPIGRNYFDEQTTIPSRGLNFTSPDNLAPGIYVVRAHYGAEGCDMGLPMVYDTITVAELGQVSISPDITTKDVTCLKEPNGEAILTVSGWAPTHRAKLVQTSYRGEAPTSLTASALYLENNVSPTSVDGNQAIFDLTGLEAGGYYLEVSDKCGSSSDRKPFVIRELLRQPKITRLSENNQLLCDYSENGSVQLLVTGGYSLANAFFQEGEPSVQITKDTIITIEGLAAGHYVFHYQSTVEGCSDQSMYEMTVAPGKTFSQHLSLEGEPCVNQKLVANITGGVYPYVVTWKNADGAVVEVDVEDGLYELSAVGTGSFYCETMDQNGCVYRSEMVAAHLVNAENMDLAIDTLMVESTQCHATDDGVVKVAFSGNKAMSAIEARLSAGGEVKQAKQSTALQDTIRFEGLPVGTYDVQLLYVEAAECALGDNAKGTVTVEHPAALAVSLTAIPVACDVEHGGKIAAKVEGGVPPYELEWLDEVENRVALVSTNELDTLKDLALGSSFFCVVRDSNNCERVSDLVKITKMDLKDLVIDEFNYSKSVLCAGQDNANVRLSLKGRDERVPVRLSVGNSTGLVKSAVLAGDENEGMVDGLAPGKYLVSVAYDDAGACALALDSSIVISPLDPLVLSDVELSHQVTCHSPQNGSIKFNVSGWAETHTAFLVFGTDTTALQPDSVKGQVAYFNEDGLSGGDIVLVKDICGAELQKTTGLHPFDNYFIAVAAEKLKLRCSYSSDAFVEVKLMNGNHGNNKVQILKQNEDKWESISHKADVQNLDLKDTLSVRFDSLTAGTYRIYFQGTEEGCTDAIFEERKVEAPNPIKFLKAVKSAVCKDSVSGEFVVAPYREGDSLKYVTFKESINMADEVVGRDTNKFSLFPGVRDIDFSLLKAPGADTLPALDTLEHAMYDGKGAAAVRVELEEPYHAIWKWDYDKNAYTCPQYWIGFTSLRAFKYFITVKDDSACVFMDTLEVKNPATPLKIDTVIFEKEVASCHADQRYVEVVVEGGWGKYAYAIDPLLEAPLDSFYSQTYVSGESSWMDKDGKGYYKSPILEPGEYRAVVVDSFGCKDSSKIIQVDAKIILQGKVSADSCGGTENRIEVTPSVTSGYAVHEPYRYALRKEDGTVADAVEGTSSGMTLTGMSKGIYGVYVYDAAGCSGYDTFYVKGADDSLFVPMTAYQMKSEPTSCKDTADGEIIFRAFGAYPPYKEFYIDDVLMDLNALKFVKIDASLKKMGETLSLGSEGLDPAVMDTFCLINLKGGAHTMTIVDSKGCKKEMQYKIKEPEALKVDTVVSSPVCPNSKEGKISVKVSGGTAPYQYAFVGSTIYSDTAFLPAPPNVEKIVQVRDANGCETKSKPTKVESSLETNKIHQTCIVSTWHDFDDVLVFIDNSVVNSGRYDSTRFELMLDTVDVDSISYKVCNPILYTYGIPNDSGYVTWYGDTLRGPIWGIPSDIAAGLKDSKHFEEEKVRVEALRNVYEQNLTKFNNTHAKEDSIKMADSYALYKQQQRANCTEKMLKDSFICLVEKDAVDRMAFIQLGSSGNLLDKIKKDSPYGDDTLFFAYGFRHILYVSGCDLTTEHNSIKVAKEGFVPYHVRKQRDIIALYATPNPVDENAPVTVTVKLSSDVGLTLEAFDMLGKNLNMKVKEQSRTEETEDGDKVYVVTYQLNLTSTSVIQVKTSREQAATTVLVIQNYRGN